MGSFNTVCGVSKAIIEEGHKVKLLILHSFGKASNHHCYSNDEFQMIFFPLDAVYTDYGTYEIQENQVSDTILSWIKERCIIRAGDRSEREFIGIPVEDLNWKNIIKVISRDNLYVNCGHYNPKSMICMMAVHEGVYQAMIDGQDDIGISYSEYLDHSGYMNMLADLNLQCNFDEAYKEAYNTISEKKDRNKLSEDKLVTMASTLARMRIENSIRELVGFNAISGCLVRDIIPLLDMEEFRKTMTDYIFFDAAFGRLYMEYRPTVLGGQCPYHKEHADMLRRIADVVESLDIDD